MPCNAIATVKVSVPAGIVADALDLEKSKDVIAQQLVQTLTPKQDLRRIQMLSDGSLKVDTTDYRITIRSKDKSIEFDPHIRIRSANDRTGSTREQIEADCREKAQVAASVVQKLAGVAFQIKVKDTLSKMSGVKVTGTQTQATAEGTMMKIKVEV